METSILHRIQALRRMSVAELAAEWERVFGSPPTSTNRQHLWRKLAWEVQARAQGGLSDAAKTRLDAMGEDAWNVATSRRPRAHEAEPSTPVEPTPKVRDIRMPVVGTVISKLYRGLELTVVVRDDGFEFDGAMFGSLTAIAKHVTGSRSINGKLFWGISQRDRGR